MELELLNATAVVLAKEHNPTILHPAFLESQKIVPADWQLAESPICTPAFSIVKYQNGIVFTAESQKFQVVDNNPDTLGPSKIPDLAIKYIQTLPHVRYTAVGINFSGFVECPSADSEVIERFLKPGSWNNEALNPRALGLRLVYPIGQLLLRFSVDSGKAKRIEDVTERVGILINANYHRELPSNNVVEGVKAAISLFQEHRNHFVQITKLIVGLEN